jgi:hypothetical protein
VAASSIGKDKQTVTTPGSPALGTAARDRATAKATWTVRQETVGEYLTRLGVFDPSTRTIRPKEIPDSDYQRAQIAINRNKIKKQMLRDLLRGGTLPAIVIVEQADGGIEIADGLQRTHVLTVAAEGLLALERGEAPDREAAAQLKEMAELGQKPLDLDTFLAQPLVEQVWKDLSSDEQLRLFMVLNVGQQKVSPRHLLEVARADLQATFQDWGIHLLTEREEKEMPSRRGRPPKDAPAMPSIATTHYRYDLLIDSLKAYVTGDPHIMTRKLLEGEGLSDKFDARITEVGSETCQHDFKWACLDLNQRIQDRYEGNTKWELAVQSSDSFLIPLFAALGKAREDANTGTHIQGYQKELLEILDQPSEDPLRLYSGPDSLDVIYQAVRSNIGRKQRAISYFAWRRFFQNGPSQADYPLNWRDAEIGS